MNPAATNANTKIAQTASPFPTSNHLTTTDTYLKEIVRVLQSYEPEKIILFGSRARGEADAYSDYDLVLIKRTQRPFLERLRDMVPYLVSLTRPVDILVYTPEELAQMGETGIGWVIKQEGIIIYERPSS